MKYDEYTELIEKHPELTTHGFGITLDPRTPHTTEEREQAWKELRADLFRRHQEFEYCCQYIAQNPDLPGKRIAYHWKHRVENWLQSNKMRPDYIPQGVFILAALHMGYRVHRIRKSDGARIGEKIS